MMTNDTLPAFPGAEGFGSTTAGGRGGRIVEVTNLAPEGPGSFRDACGQTGPRIIVFRTGGTIRINRDIRVEGLATIAGQTAPGDGICIRGAGIDIQGNDVIVRGLRIRVGRDPDGEPWNDRHALLFSGAHIVVDHCSLSWAVDENVSSGWRAGAHDVSIQWCLISECLSHAGHSKNEHSKGILISSDSRDISVHHNLFVHNTERSPYVQHGRTYDIVNNVAYNYGKQPMQVLSGTEPFTQKVNVVGNFVKKGPNSVADYGLLVWDQGSPGQQMYLRGNVGPGRMEDSGEEWSIVGTRIRKFAVDKPNPVPPVTTYPWNVARDLVVANAGALCPTRDPVDIRLVNDFHCGTGKIIDSPEEAGGWPVYAVGSPPKDSDRDGIPDDWELQNGLDPLKTDGDSVAPSGYTWVEEYINGLILRCQSSG